MDKDAQTVARYSYDAWGVCTNIVNHTDLTGGVPIANINPYRYRSYYFDHETDLYYLQSRYYDAGVGRFINADDLLVFLNENVIVYSLFAYCNNIPTIMVDLVGYAPKYILDQGAEPYASMKLSGKATVGDSGCGVVAVYNVLHKYSKKIEFKPIIKQLLKTPASIGSKYIGGLLGLANWLYNKKGTYGVSIFSMITYLKKKFWFVTSTYGITTLWGMKAESCGALIVAYMKKNGVGHYVAGIKCGGGVGGRFKFYNSDWISEKKEYSIWNYLDIIKKHGAKPLALVTVAKKKGWW